MTGPHWVGEPAPEVTWLRVPKPPQPQGGWWQTQGLSSGACVPTWEPGSWASPGAGRSAQSPSQGRLSPALLCAHRLTVMPGNNQVVWAEPTGQEVASAVGAGLAPRAQVTTPEGFPADPPAAEEHGGGEGKGVSPGLAGTRPSWGGRCPSGQKPAQGR